MSYLSWVQPLSMSKTPLRRFLEESEQSAEAFAASHHFSPWTIRHYARGDKMPSFRAQRALNDATGGAVTPNDWLEWSSQQTAKQADAA